MLSIILVYFVGKAFYDLAGLHNRSKWGYAILGLASYYIFALPIGLVMVLLGEFDVLPVFKDMNENVLSLILIPFGAVGCWLTYRFLQARWSKKPSSSETAPDVLDSDLINQHREL